jgi:hypothetical protein
MQVLLLLGVEPAPVAAMAVAPAQTTPSVLSSSFDFMSLGQLRPHTGAAWTGWGAWIG